MIELKKLISTIRAISVQEYNMNRIKSLVFLPLKTILLISFLSLPIASATIYAQEVWTLQRCIDEALKNNLTLQSGEIAKNNASIDVKLAEQARYPSLNAGTNVGFNFGRTVDPTTNQFIQETFFSNNYSLNSGVTIFNGFRINNTIKQANLDAKIAVTNQQQTERNITLDVSSAYLNALFANENLTISKNNLDITAQQLDVLSRLIRAGSRPDNDIFETEAQFAQNEQAVVTAENNQNIAILRLKQLMNIDLTIDVRVGASVDVGTLTDPITIDLDQLIQQGQANQPSIKALELGIQSSQFGVKIAESRRYPSIGANINLASIYSNKGFVVTGLEQSIINRNLIVNNTPVVVGFPTEIPTFTKKTYDNQLQDNLSYGFGIGLQMPIYANHTIKGGIDRANLQVENAQINLKAEKQRVNATVQQAYVDAKAAKSSLAASEKSLTAQKNAYNAAVKRLEAGAINTFDLNTIKTRLDIANLNFVNAKYEYIFRSKVLDFYLGRKITMN